MNILLEVSRHRSHTIGGPPARLRANYGGQGIQESEFRMAFDSCDMLDFEITSA